MSQLYRIIRFIVALGVLLLITLSVTFPGGIGSWLPSVQSGAVLVGFASGVTLGGLVAMLAGLVTALLFGRIFCSIICPLGILQDVVVRLVCSRRRVFVPNFRTVRYGVAIAVFTLLAAGTATGFRVLDPFSRFGSMVAAIQALGRHYIFGGILPYVPYIGLLSVAGIVALSVWKRRLFCTAICPVGTLLGLCARFSLFGMRLAPSCIACGRCEADCPTGCISISSSRVDNERCVLCLNCLSRCPTNGIVYSSKRKTTPAPAINPSRRGFLLAVSTAMAGAVAIGCGLRKPIRMLAATDKGKILPPGANGADRFERLCIGCQLCVAACPDRIIRPGAFGLGTVSLDYNLGKCDSECNRCTQVCPTGALRPLTLADKQWTRIGEAVIDASHCKAAQQGEQCDLCTSACPKGAIFMMDRPNGLKIPEVAAFHCIGCGACQAVCPTRPKAITVKPADESLF